MASTSQLVASAALGVVIACGTPSTSAAQGISRFPVQPASRPASFPPGSIRGVVLDDEGRPIAYALVTAVGPSTIAEVSDSNGRFELRSLPPGPYVVRAHLSGYVTPAAQAVQVGSGARVASFPTLTRVSVPVLAAGFVLPDLQPAAAPTAPADQADDADGAAAADASSDAEPSETAWRIRHARRSVLKEQALAGLPSASDQGPESPLTSLTGPADFLGRAVESSARLAASFFTDTPFSGQVNLLTTGSFDDPQQLFSPDMTPTGTANFSVGAPAGLGADWTARGAVTQSDISSWMVAGSYVTRAPARQQHNVGLSYSMQRYDGRNPLALRSVTDGSRNVGELYAFETFTVTPVVALSYGVRYGRYDYLDRRNLVSPRVELAVTPGEHLRISALMSRGAHAPGAEEFLPPSEEGIWLPPQRTFSSLNPDRPLRAERTTHTALEVERDIAGSTIEVRVFRQRVSDQLATLFGAEGPGQPVAKLGHYLVENAGNVEAAGYAAGVSRALSAWVRGSIEYSVTNARLTPNEDVRYLMLAAPSAVRPHAERIQNVSTTVETTVPETWTRVLVLYRVSNGFARPSSQSASNGPGLDARFDVQVRQSLPFMNFTNAKWEMLLAVRNFFHETAVEHSVYDELLVVRPPKRVVGGLTMHF